ncbi:MAG: NAD(P)/FAD-dependent oxidoreductase [Bacteroidetes bacterium]|nr:NAD(P)/FAD-dependent oxidoreductase [Bacteroidota bacterium]
MNNILIIGGGLAGLTSAILLQQNGFEVSVFEKKKYPFHRVCGEYISNEVLQFLESLNFGISESGYSTINRLEVSSVSGKILKAELPSGGFGLSRFKLDHLLYQRAKSLGVTFIFEKVDHINFQDDKFRITIPGKGEYESAIAIAAYGKRSNLDQKLNRSFFYRRSPYLGVKYHIRTELAENLIRLDNFQGGYSGVSRIEDEKFCLCYLSETANLKKYSGIAEMEEQVLFKNPRLKSLFRNSEFLFENPIVINEISFAKKTLTENHLLFCGDSAGMITPLCGNGMAIAIHSGKILADSIISHVKKDSELNRLALENDYKLRWEKQFSLRLQSGRLIQKLFGSTLVSDLTVSVLGKLPTLTQKLVKKTHGDTLMY